MDRELARIARRLSTPVPGMTPYSPPAMADLVRRIDVAQSGRRAA